ncbi:MAG: hypothetical protein A2857_02575 [Candidatus Levybacteria bacterium RIFCSPHIGHO2_01_FULL_36_15]|nr:MAG: hypothetical protein A2857_02575 [Candidatus Levybacteria bacterium RIFCSPHIGHO2_01_FULL_36_15]OGH38873.1 MAG: hypothetical protein A2905_04290 [Candidatus Levybacteria bacterium RIFCSPLOWO2_01_FULL_36_10]
MDKISFIPIGGIGDVTKNMYLYENDEGIIIVDCGLGFPDETMPGVDLLIPDIAYLKKTNKKILGMILTHGHEDHIGALPFALPKLPEFPIYGSKLTAALANEKLRDFQVKRNVQTVSFGDEVTLGNFKVTFIRVTHSILDAANLLIKTPIGNFYHASDFKFDFTPVDGRRSQLDKIAKAGSEGILCLFSDCLGSLREGHSPSEQMLYESFEDEFRKTRGKIFVTTYSSNISRLNQAIEVGLKLGRKICFIGRSLINAKEIGREMGYMTYPLTSEIKPFEIRKHKPSSLLIFVAGSQAQENSALVRIANDEDRDIKIQKGDTVIFSADPIPGNENSINGLIDVISKKGAKVVYSDITDEFHVSGHGYSSDLKLMISLTNPKYLLPISSDYKQMVGYKDIGLSMGYKEENILLIDSGQEVVFTIGSVNLGRKIEIANIFVDEVTHEKLEDYVLVDRLRISKEGIIVIISEIDSSTGQLVGKPDIIARGFIYDKKDEFSNRLASNMNKILGKKHERVTNWAYYRNIIKQRAEDYLFKEGREPLVIPIVLEV